MNRYEKFIFEEKAAAGRLAAIRGGLDHGLVVEAVQAGIVQDAREPVNKASFAPDGAEEYVPVSPAGDTFKAIREGRCRRDHPLLWLGVDEQRRRQRRR